MQITIYNKDGSVFKSLECVEIAPLCGDYKAIILSRIQDGPVAVIEIGNTIGDYLYTNLPFSVEGKLHERQEEPSTVAKTTVTLLSENGAVIRSWENVIGLSFLRDIISFKSNEKWYAVCGNVIITPMTEDKNEK